MKDYRTVGGYGLIGVAGLLMLSNLGEAWMDLNDWHGAASVITPAFVAIIIKQAVGLSTAAMGGAMLPQVGAKWDGRDRRGRR